MQLRQRMVSNIIGIMRRLSFCSFVALTLFPLGAGAQALDKRARFAE